MAQSIFGLIGTSLKHSFSPDIHNAVFKKLAINARYRIFELEEEQLKSFLSSAFAKSIRGLNVTIPYKEKVIPFLTRLDADTPSAFTIGAVNTIKVEERGLTGYNTDGGGFIDALNRIERRENHRPFDFKSKLCVILGAGGAAKAVAFALAAQNVGGLYIYDIDHPKSKKLAAEIGSKFPKSFPQALESKEQLEAIEDSQILVNATPIGMKATDAPVVNEDFLHKDLFVFDCVYNPKGRQRTILVEEARKKGLRAFDGLWMLICQAIRSQKIWLGRKILEDEIFRIMAGALEERGHPLC
ncbi:MAG: shikimate dehydrogenase [Candidatus Omnitrophica bacterium]|nr:shikimate dehydrogenase [Candidatus Omnitrophota bacterium]